MKETITMTYSFELEYNKPEARDDIIRTLRGDPVLSLCASTGAYNYCIRRIKNSGEETSDAHP